MTPPTLPGAAAAASGATRTAPVVVLACCIIMIAMGTRLTVGLFVQPIQDSTGLSIAAISMALAIGQLFWGIFQPVFGAWADRGHPFAALASGMLCIAAGQALTVWANNFWLFTLAQGILAPAGVAAGSFAGLIGIAVSRLPARTHTVAGGIINAGGSVGQGVYAPLVHWLTHVWGYCAGLWVLAGLALAALAPAWLLCRINPLQGAETTQTLSPLAREKLGEQVRVALRNPSYLLLNAGFFTCGFHVAFLITHLPGEIAMCGHSSAVSATSISLIGLCNVAGSIGVGYICRYFLMKHVLASVYVLRAVVIFIYLFVPKTATTFYIFACAIGFTWLATVPPTAGIVDKLFGKRYLATLFGLTFVSHQLGGFFGAWLGGIAMEQTGNFLWIWYVDCILALCAAMVNLPIKETISGGISQ